jgi:hypothetical protein
MRGVIALAVMLVVVGIGSALACGSNSSGNTEGVDAAADAPATDAGSDACPTANVDARCDLSNLPAALLTCGDWIGHQTPGSPVSLPGGWSGTSDMNGTDEYIWIDSGGSPDLCSLPPAPNDSGGPFTWLHPLCDAGCP